MVKSDGKRWPVDFKNSEKLSLLKGDVIKIGCGPNYDIIEDGEFKVQGSEKFLTKVMSQICILRKGGHNVSQIDCDDLLKQFSGEKEPEPVISVEQNDKQKKVARTRKDVELPFQNEKNFNDDGEDDDETDEDGLADLPELPPGILNQFLGENLEKRPAAMEEQGPSSGRSNNQQVNLIKQ